MNQTAGSEWARDHVGVCVEMRGEQWTLDRVDETRVVLTGEHGERRRMDADWFRRMFVRQNLPWEAMS